MRNFQRFTLLPLLLLLLLPASPSPAFTPPLPPGAPAWPAANPGSASYPEEDAPPLPEEVAPPADPTEEILPPPPGLDGASNGPSRDPAEVVEPRPASGERRDASGAAPDAAKSRPAAGSKEERTVELDLGLPAPALVHTLAVPNLPSRRITALAHNPGRGVLYVATADAGIVALRLEDFERDPPFRGLPPELKGEVSFLFFVRPDELDKYISAAPGGLLVAGSSHGTHLLPLRPDGTPTHLPLTLSPDPNRRALHAAALIPGGEGTLLLASAAGLFTATPGGSAIPVATAVPPEGVRVRAVRPLGKDLVLCTDFGLYATEDAARFRLVSRAEHGLSPMRLDARLFGEDLVVSLSPRGVAAGKEDLDHAPLPREERQGLPDDEPTALDAIPLPGVEEPPTAGLIVGFARGKIALLGAAGFVPLPPADERTPAGRVNALLRTGDALYAATEAGLLRHRFEFAKAPPAPPPAVKPPAKKGALPPDGELIRSIRDRFGVAMNGPWSVESLRAHHRTLEALPAAFRSACRTMTRMGNGGNLGGLGTVGAPGWIRLYDAAFRDDPTGIRIVVHEMVHNFQGNAAVTDRWKREIKGPSCTGYGNTNPYEDMAESVSYYYTKPALLKSRHPSRYEFIREHIMAGREFRGDEWL